MDRNTKMHAVLASRTADKAIVDSRLCPGTELTMISSGLYRWVKFGWNLSCCACRVLSSLIRIHMTSRKIIRWKHDVIHKLEIHNLLQSCQGWTIGNMHTNLVKFGCVVFELCKSTDKQTNRHTHHDTFHPPGGKEIIHNYIYARGVVRVKYFNQLITEL